MTERIVREYLLLGLRLGRHINGFVDCWFGAPQLSARVEAEPLANPLDLAATADRLRAELADTELAEPRRRFLAAQLRALACTARRLAGTEMSFVDEVREYFEVDIVLTDPDRYAAAHHTLTELLPGPGDLCTRMTDFARRNQVPPDQLGAAVRAVSEAVRDRVRPLFGLADAEEIDYEVVSDRPWHAFNRYRGGFRSTVALNDQAGQPVGALPVLVTHESYPGHHTEHCVKEAELVRAGGQDEQRIALVNTPQCLVSEGMAEHALGVALGPGWGAWTSSILAEQGVHTEGELVERVLAQIECLLPARQDAAILLHDRGVPVDEVVAYLQRWLLLPPERAEHMARFLTDPLWRAYSVTYIEGKRLVGARLAARPSDVSPIDHYHALLRSPL